MKTKTFMCQRKAFNFLSFLSFKTFHFVIYSSSLWPENEKKIISFSIFFSHIWKRKLVQTRETGKGSWWKMWEIKEEKTFLYFFIRMFAFVVMPGTFFIWIFFSHFLLSPDVGNPLFNYISHEQWCLIFFVLDVLIWAFALAEALIFPASLSRK